jgi:uncharacterized membrane protein YcaP (DUF421 family)
MWDLSFSWWEFIARGLIVYSFLLIALRLTGRRQRGDIAPSDLVLLLILSNAVQNAMNGGDNSVLGGLILAATLISAHYFMAFLTYRWRWLERIVDGTPQVLIKNGVVNKAVLEREFITHHDLDLALRTANVKDILNVKLAVLENNGHITVRTDETVPLKAPSDR